MIAPDARPRLLIVDDTPAHLERLLDALEDDYEIHLATSGRQALALLERLAPPDLILLDLMMPDLDGYAVCAALKECPATRGIPVIFVTARLDPAVEARALAAGAVDVLPKPVNPAAARARVGRHLELKSPRALADGANGS